MTTNEVLTRQNFITKLLLKDGENELSKDLKVKIMKMRIEYKKIRTTFDADLQEFIQDLVTDRFRELQQKQDKSEEETKEFNELVNKINSEYNSYVQQRGLDEVNCKEYSFTEDEFDEIVSVNAGNDVEINGTQVLSGDFLEILYTLFVKE